MRILQLVIMMLFSYCVHAQQIPAYSADAIIKHTSSKDTLYIINFWATWCGPCVQELPEFNALAQRYKNAPVKVLMVSLDFREDYPMKLARFVERKRLTPEVVWLSDTNPNDFVPKIDGSWGGSIPATIIVHPGKGFRKFIEGQITQRQVCNIADKLLKKDAEPDEDD